MMCHVENERESIWDSKSWDDSHCNCPRLEPVREEGTVGGDSVDVDSMQIVKGNYVQSIDGVVVGDDQNLRGEMPSGESLETGSRYIYEAEEF